MSSPLIKISAGTSSLASTAQLNVLDNSLPLEATATPRRMHSSLRHKTSTRRLLLFHRLQQHSILKLHHSPLLIASTLRPPQPHSQSPPFPQASALSCGSMHSPHSAPTAPLSCILKNHRTFAADFLRLCVGLSRALRPSSSARSPTRENVAYPATSHGAVRSISHFALLRFRVMRTIDGARK